MSATASKTAAHHSPTQSSSIPPAPPAAAANARPLADKFYPADPNERDMYPFPPNQRRKFELFDPDELLALAACQRDVYKEKLAIMVQHRCAMRVYHKGHEWSYEARVEYSRVKEYQELLSEKMTFWERMHVDALQHKIDVEAFEGE